MRIIYKLILPYTLLSISLLSMVFYGYLPWWASIPTWPLMGIGGIGVSKGLSDLFNAKPST